MCETAARRSCEHNGLTIHTNLALNAEWWNIIIISRRKKGAMGVMSDLSVGINAAFDGKAMPEAKSSKCQTEQK